MMRRAELAFSLSLLLVPMFIAPAQAQPAELCPANAVYHERWAQQLVNVNPDAWQFSSIAVSPDGEMLAVGTPTSIGIYDTQTLDLLFELDRIGAGEEPYRTYGVSWSPDSQRLAVAHYLVNFSEQPNPRNGVEIWNIQSRELEYNLPFEPSMAVWSPDGAMIAVADQYGAISALEPNRYTVIPLTDVGFGFDAMAWSPDSQQIAVNDRAVPLMIYEISGAPLKTIDIPEMSGGTYLTWSPNSVNLAMGNGVVTEIFIWDDASYEVMRTLEGRTGRGFDLQWSPDGNLLARGAQYGLFFWDITSDSPDPIHAFTENVPPFAGISWLPDGEHIISVDFEGSIYRWDIETGCVEVAILNDRPP